MRCPHDTRGSTIRTDPGLTNMLQQLLRIMENCTVEIVKNLILQQRQPRHQLVRRNSRVDSSGCSTASGRNPVLEKDLWRKRRAGTSPLQPRGWLRSRSPGRNSRSSVLLHRNRCHSSSVTSRILVFSAISHGQEAVEDGWLEPRTARRNVPTLVIH